MIEYSAVGYLVDSEYEAYCSCSKW